MMSILKTRILVIDDAATVRMYHRSILEEGGYDVDEAVNGVEALEKALQHSYQLYLVDINMPKMDGYSFLQALRSDLSITQAPAVMVSTEAKAKDEQRAYEVGANFYIIKPIKPEKLLDICQMLVGPGGEQ